MSGFTTAFKGDLLNHLLNNANLANLGDSTGLRGSSTAGNLYVALHTADPGASGTQSTNETTYGSYARESTGRASDWTVSSGQATNANTITFPTPSSGSGTITHVSIGFLTSGAGEILICGALSSPITITTGGPIIFPPGTITLKFTP